MKSSIVLEADVCLTFQCYPNTCEPYYTFRLRLVGQDCTVIVRDLTREQLQRLYEAIGGQLDGPGSVRSGFRPFTGG